MMEDRTDTFVSNYQRALSDATLQEALSTATGNALGARELAVREVGVEQWEALRTRAREIKEHTAGRLDYYLETFADGVERSGGKVFWAADAEEANGYVAELARARGVSVAVKGKSMMTEEIGLNRALAAAGVEAVETDLGEYIVQLAGERPSHINMPAIHKTRKKVAELFTEKLGVEYTEDIDRMKELARRTLRHRFVEAGMGITGVNYAAADTGTIVLVENEGNIRLTTSLPRVHVAVMGLEKVIPRLADLDVFLRLLSRSASGQKLCSYVSLLTGVRRGDGDEGPEELHVIILDNGRSQILADPHLRESLFCIRCGACLNVCPVYQKIGGHAYGWVYPGPIGAVLTPQLFGRERAADLPFASTLCGACRDICPVKIDIPGMLLRLRHEVQEGPQAAAPAVGEAHATGPRAADEAARSRTARGPRSSVGSRLKRLVSALCERAALKLWAAATRDAARYGRAARLARLAQVLLTGSGPVGVKTLSVPRWSATRDFPPLAPASFREQWAELKKKNPPADAEPEGRASRVASPESPADAPARLYNIEGRARRGGGV